MTRTESSQEKRSRFLIYKRHGKKGRSPTNKTEFISALAEKGYTKKAAESIIDDVFAVISEALVNGEDVRVHGFGTFSVRESSEKETINPKNPEERILIPSHKSPKFTPGKQLKRSVRDGILRE